LGFDAVYVTDHPAPDLKWLEAGGHHALDPFVALSFAAAATTGLGLQTHILVLPYRNPFLTAKSVQSLQLLSGNRFVLGVGAGYLKAEFRALGADFDGRNEALDVGVDVLRAALRNDVVAAEGQGWSARGVFMRPPVEPPRVWIGGNSREAMRRAVERGDGWVPFPNPPEAARTVRTPTIASVGELAARLDELRVMQEEAGRTAPLDVCFAPFSLLDGQPFDAGAVVDELQALAGAGVTAVCIGARGDTRAEWLRSAARLAHEVVEPFRAAAST
jgi:probable F420-dependent oxidoreductase